jgi:hypothetical protein
MDSGREVRFNISEHPHLDHDTPSPATAARDRLRTEF